MDDLIEKFKNREIKAKDLFVVDMIDNNKSRDLISKYHYLGNKKYMCTYTFGIRFKNSVDYLGCAVFGQVGGISTLKGWFSLTNSSTDILELTRLVMNPSLNNTNATSYLLSNAIKVLKTKNIRAVISLADSSRHYGYIYQACNFSYFGLSDNKSDFYRIDGKVNPRGETKLMKGVWLPRSRKHRYCYIIDKSLKINYKEENYPKGNEYEQLQCCNGTFKVYDKRYNMWFACPRCTNKMDQL